MRHSIYGLLALAISAAPLSAQSGQKASGPSDAEIAAIVVAANAIDAEMGDLAVKNGRNTDIKDYGILMGKSHRAVNAAAVELVTKLKVTPVENEVSRKLRADASAFKATLLKKSGKAFDRAYIEHEVAYHKAVIGAVDDVLIPNAKNEELKATLIGVRPVLVSHFEHAEHLLANLK